MFTRIAKGFLWILMIGVVIDAIVTAVALEDAACFFVVLLAEAVILMFFGMFVELCNNILDIRTYWNNGVMNR